MPPFHDPVAAFRRKAIYIYENAIADAENGSYDRAIRVFESLGEYKDSVMLIAYYQARQMEDAESYDAALEAYEEIQLFKDSKERIKDIKTRIYENAIADAENGSYDRAISVFESLGEFEDSAMLITYYQARQMEDAGNYEAALKVYKEIPRIKDSNERIESIPKRVYDSVYFTLDSELLQVKKDEKYGYIDAGGKNVIPCEYEYSRVYPFSEGLGWLKKDGKYGCIDVNGEIVSPCEWDYVGFFQKDWLWWKRMANMDTSMPAERT